MNLTCCVAIWIAAIVLVQGPTAQSREAADAAELSSLENVWNEAHIHGDAGVLDRLWADDFVVTVLAWR